MQVLEGSGDQTMKLAHKHLEAGNLVDARESCAWAQAEWENAGVDRYVNTVPPSLCPCLSASLCVCVFLFESLGQKSAVLGR